MLRTATYIASVLALVVIAQPAAAQGNPESAPATRVNYVRDADQKRNAKEIPVEKLSQDEGTLVFSAPPHQTREASTQTYTPIAEYLSKVVGRKIVYTHPGDWLTYQTEMKKGSYDLVFDGPHFNSWRAAKLQHNILAKLPGDHVFVVVVKKDNKITEIKQLNGRPVCAMDPPNLGTLTLLNQFDNPARQPVIVNTNGWDNIYKGVLGDQCVAGILPLKNLEKFDRGTFTRVIFKAKALPNQAFSAGQRIARADQAKIAQALLSTEANGPTAKLRETYAVEGGFSPALKEEYAGLGVWLKDTWGF